MAFAVQDMLSNLPYGGARPSLFQVQITNPISNVADQKLTFLCKAASIPEWELGVVNVAYFGRRIPYPGNRTFAPWTVTIYNDEDFLIRNAMETWSNAINSVTQNIMQVGPQSTAYMSQGTITSFGKTGNVLRTYQANGLWPSQLGPMELDWENADQIQTFTATFQLADFEVTSTLTGNPGT